LYKEEYDKEVKGKLTAQDIEFYPEHKHAIQVGKLSSQVMYLPHTKFVR